MISKGKRLKKREFKSLFNNYRGFNYYIYLRLYVISMIAIILTAIFACCIIEKAKINAEETIKKSIIYYEETISFADQERDIIQSKVLDLQDEVLSLNEDIINLEISKETISNEITILNENRKTIELDMLNEIFLFAKLIQAEASSESLQGKTAVANVILNRISSNRFPNTITEVILQENQFEPVTKNTLEISIPTTDCYTAISNALNGNDESKGALYFYSPEYVTDEVILEWFNSLTETIVIENHIFLK